jgi:hypothetical protein
VQPNRTAKKKSTKPKNNATRAEFEAAGISMPDSWIAVVDDKARIGRVRISEDEVSPLYCSAEWHIARFKGAGVFYCYPIYSLAFRLSQNSGRFTPSIPTLAKYLKADEKVIRGAIHLLTLAGLFVMLEAAEGKSVAYRPVPHEEWAESHPGYCINKDELPAYMRGDALGRDMHAVSGGRYKTFSNYLKAFRKVVNDDAAILDHWRRYVELHDLAGQSWKKGVTRRFLEFLRTETGVTPP